MEGRVTRLLVEEGLWIEKGAVLASLVRDDAQIALSGPSVRTMRSMKAIVKGGSPLC